MPIYNQGKEYYPLDFGKMVKDGKVYYDRSARGKSYFYIDLRWPPEYGRFIPDGSSGLITADNNVFCVKV